MSSKTKSLLAMQQPLSGTAAFQRDMREAALEGITREDVVEIVRHQVDEAKKGNAKAIRFVFDYLLNGKGPQVAIQNNFLGDNGGKRQKCAEDKIRQKRSRKLPELTARAQRGDPLFEEEAEE